GRTLCGNALPFHTGWGQACVLLAQGLGEHRDDVVGLAPPSDASGDAPVGPRLSGVVAPVVPAAVLRRVVALVVEPTEAQPGLVGTPSGLVGQEPVEGGPAGINLHVGVAGTVLDSVAHLVPPLPQRVAHHWHGTRERPGP